MKLWIVLLIGASVLVGCEKDPYAGKSEGSGGAGPGYDGTGSGPAATNVNNDTNPDSAK